MVDEAEASAIATVSADLESAKPLVRGGSDEAVQRLSEIEAKIGALLGSGVSPEAGAKPATP